MTAGTRALDLRESLEAAGHSGVCDHPGCVALAEWAVAEECGGGCDRANTPAVSAYCSTHVMGAPVARREAVEDQLWRDVETRTRTWGALLDAWPDPLPLTTWTRRT